MYEGKTKIWSNSRNMISDDEGDKLENNDHWLIVRVRIIHFAIFYIKKISIFCFPFSGSTTLKGLEAIKWV